MVATRTFREPLTKRQKEFFKYVVRHFGQSGRMPTYREIAKEFDFSSLNLVRSVFVALEKKGWIKVHRNKDTNFTTSIEIPGLTDRLAIVASSYMKLIDSSPIKPTGREAHKEYV